MSGTYGIGLMGPAVMGQNLVLNMVDHGFKVADYIAGNAAFFHGKPDGTAD